MVAFWVESGAIKSLKDENFPSVVNPLSPAGYDLKVVLSEPCFAFVYVCYEAALIKSQIYSAVYFWRIFKTHPSPQPSARV